MYSVINYSASCRSKPVRPSFFFRTQILLMKSVSSFPLIDSKGTTMIKAQKRRKEIGKVQPQVYKATRILFVHQENKNNNFIHLFDERRSYGFGTTWGWAINDRIFIFGWTIPLKKYPLFEVNNEMWEGAQNRGPLYFTKVHPLGDFCPRHWITKETNVQKTPYPNCGTDFQENSHFYLLHRDFCSWVQVKSDADFPKSFHFTKTELFHLNGSECNLLNREIIFQHSCCSFWFFCIWIIWKCLTPWVIITW